MVFLENISLSPPLAGNSITKATIQIKPPPNQATNARQRCIGLDRRSFSNTGKPVVVKAPTISKYVSKKLIFDRIIQLGSAKNIGTVKNKSNKEISCITPDSFKFLFEVAKFIKEKITKI